MSAIKTPVAWQLFDNWALTGQHGMRPIYLSVMHGKLCVRDEATDRRVPFTPEHPIAKEIVAALNVRDELLEACQQAEHWLTAEAQSPHPGATKPDMILTVLRNALAKAEGIPF